MRKPLAAIQREKVTGIAMGLRILPALPYGKEHSYGNSLTGSGTEESHHPPGVGNSGTEGKPRGECELLRLRGRSSIACCHTKEVVGVTVRPAEDHPLTGVFFCCHPG